MSNWGQKLLITVLISVAMSSAGMAAPTAYSINSDSGTLNAEGLYQIDLASGNDTRIATVQAFGEAKRDVEGLAFSPSGTLYGLDDESHTLFPINTANGAVNSAEEVLITGLPVGGLHDFGMTFACDDSLYISSVRQESVYRMALDGSAQVIGSEGTLAGLNISALAAYGNPVELYGLSNGTLSDNSNTPTLYSINTMTGLASEIGPLGGNAAAYNEGGLAFDDSGQLWAITDRRNNDSASSQVMKLNKGSGEATEVENTQESGFESLAITVPRGCEPVNNGPAARFVVQKQFVNNEQNLPSTLRISCNQGTKLEQEFTVLPNPGSFGPAEVTFTVTNISEGETDCEVFEDVPPGYEDSYECFSDGNCSASETECIFTDITLDQQNLCTISSTPLPVAVNVAKEWDFHVQEQPVEQPVQVTLICDRVYDGNGSYYPDQTMRWSWLFGNPSNPQQALVRPMGDGSTRCWTEETVLNSATEVISECTEDTVIRPGDAEMTCTVFNTVFFEGIPTLSEWGLIMLVLSVLGVGLVASRRI